MSFQASTWVIKHSKQKGSALLVLLMIANHAHADGTNAFPSIKTLAAECRMSERQVIRLVAHLEKSGELLLERSHGRTVHNYSISMVANPDKLSASNPDKSGKPTLTSCHPNPDKSGKPTLTNQVFPIYKDEQSIEQSINTQEEKKNASVKNSILQTDTLSTNTNFNAADSPYLNAAITTLQRKKMDSPFSMPDWYRTIAYTERLHPNAELFEKCIDAIALWAKGRITPKMVADNFGQFLSTLDKPKTEIQVGINNNGQFKSAQEKRSERAVRDFQIEEQLRAKVEARRNGNV